MKDASIATRKGRQAIDDIDTVIATVLRGRLDSHIYRVDAETGTAFEIFDNGLWRLNCEPGYLCGYVKTELKQLFGKQNQDQHFNISFGGPPAPMAKDAYIGRVAKCLIQYVPHKTIAALDNDASLKLMDCSGKVVDFEVDARVNPDGQITKEHGNKPRPKTAYYSEYPTLCQTGRLQKKPDNQR